MRNGSVNVRSADDVDENTLAFAEIKALATGNPLIKEKMDLDLQVHKLNLLKTAYLRNHHALEEKVAKTYPATIADCNVKIKNIKKDLQALAQLGQEAVPIVINGIAYTKDDAPAALEKVMGGKHPEAAKMIGQYKSFSILLSYSFLKDSYSITLKGAHSYSFDAYKSGKRNLEKMDEMIEKISEVLKRFELKLASTENEVIKAKEELSKPFAQAEELKEKNHRLTELNILMNIEGNAAKEDVIKDARNPATPSELLSKLSTHDAEEVREAVASNPNTSMEDVLRLKDDECEAVSLAAYLNPNMPQQMVEDYCAKASMEHLSSILEHGNLSNSVLEAILKRADGTNNLTYNLVNYSKTTLEMLHVLAGFGNIYINMSILKKENVLPETIALIGEKCDLKQWYYARDIVSHKNCPEETLFRFCNVTELQSAILEHPNISERILREITTTASYPKSRHRAEELLDDMYKDIPISHETGFISQESLYR